MKRIVKVVSSGKVVLAIVSCILPFIAIAADAPPSATRPAPERNVRGEFRPRDGGMPLDPQQQQLFREALQKYGDELARIQGQLGSAMTELMQATLADNFDEKIAREKAEVIAKIQAQMMLRRSQALAAVAPTLRPEQRENLLTGPAGSMLLAGGLPETRNPGTEPGGPERAPNRGPQPPSDPLSENLFPPELVMRFQDQIGLTDEQRQATMAELQEAQQKFANLHQQLEKEKAALAALLKKEKVELDPALAQADKLLDVERELRRFQLGLQIRLKNRLTPEQQEKLLDLKNQQRPGNPMAAGAPPAMQAKMQRLQAGIQRWQREGRDPSAIGRTMRKFESLLQAGQIEEAEAALDEALQILAEGKRPR